MSIIKKEAKNKAVSTKITEKQEEKIINLALKHGITKSNLINQLIEAGYKELTKKKTF